jgi:hypothetical protein
MSILPTALALSAVLHTAAIAWVQTRPDDKPEEPPLVTLQPIQIVPVTVADPEPMTVALLDDHTVAIPLPAARNTRTTPTTSSPTNMGARIETGRAATVETPVEKPGTQRHSMMTMRHPEIDKGPSSDFVGRFLDNTKPLKPNDIRGEQLQSELAASNSNLKNPRWIANATPDQVTAERLNRMALRDERRNAELQPDGAGKKAEHQTFTVRVAADGTAKIEDKANLQRKGLLGGSFDVTDAMMRRQGIDPYASYKLKVLDETRDERVAIGKRHRTQQLAQSTQLMQKNLERLWAMSADIPALKQGLFELWDDCAETGPEMERGGFTPPSGTDELVAGGNAARKHLLGFLVAKLPAGSADAYTTAELARFNKRRKSQATFAPY